MRILFLSRWFPYPANNGSKIRIYGLIRALAMEHKINLLSFREDSLNMGVPQELAEICESVEYVVWEDYNPRSLHAKLGYFSRTPRSLTDTFSDEMCERICSELKQRSYDLVVCSQLTSLSYAKYMQGLPVILEELELGLFYPDHADHNNLYQQIRSRLTWYKLRHYIVDQLQYIRAVTVVSERERSEFRKVIPEYENIEVIPNGYDTSQCETQATEQVQDQLIFAGAFSYRVNYDAMVWFLEEVLPLIQSNRPNVQLLITGDHLNLPLPKSKGVTLTGMVDDILSLVAKSSCSIVPLLQGGGTRLKILEAMACGTPVVSTSKGAEGLDVVNNKHLLIADTPDEFANAVLRILNDPKLHESLSVNGRELVTMQYDWQVITPKFLDLVNRVAN